MGKQNEFTVETWKKAMKILMRSTETEVGDDGISLLIATPREGFYKDWEAAPYEMVEHVVRCFDSALKQQEENGHT